MRKLDFYLCKKTKALISFEVTAKQISALVFPVWIVQFYLLLKSTISSLYPASVTVQAGFMSELVGMPKDRFSRVAAQIVI